MTDKTQLTNMESLVIEAKKLREVCLIAFPDRVGEMDAEYPWDFLVELGESRAHWYPDANCMDDLRRVLLALTPGQRRKFDENLEQAWYQQPEQDDVSDYLMFWFCLTAPTSTILDALHRAVCPE